MYLSMLKVNTGDNPDRPQPGRRWLGDVYRVHQRLWMAFPDAGTVEEDPFFLGAWNPNEADAPKPGRNRCGFLFRIERDGDPRILVQSVERPNWEYAFQNAPYLLREDAKIREFDPSPEEGRRYRFRVLLNVVETTRVAHPSGKVRMTKAGHEIVRRKRVDKALLPPVLPVRLSEQKQMDELWNPWREWFGKLAEDRGFLIGVADRRSLRMESVYLVVRKPARGEERRRRPAGRYNAGLFEGVLTCTDAAALRRTLTEGLGHAKAFGFGLLSVAPV